MDVTNRRELARKALDGYLSGQGASTRSTARALAEGLFRLGLAVDLGAVETNMVYLEVEDPEGFLQGLRARGVLAGRVGGRVRFVTHRDLMDEDIPLTLERVQDLLHSRPR